MRRHLVIAILALVTVFVLACCFAGTVSAAPSVNPNAVHLQDAFDPMGPTVHSLTLPSGRVVNYVDVGQPGWRPAVFIGGTGTTCRELELTDFALTSQEALKLRIICVERNGLGQTLFDPSLGYADYTSDVLAVLDHLNINAFVLYAVSGGGPYAADIAATVPNRIISIHLAAALREEPASWPLRFWPPAQLLAYSIYATQNPMLWWAEPADSPVQQIPGWQDTAYEEGARAFFVRGQMDDGHPWAHELQLYMQSPVDVSQVTAPVYLYWGTADSTTILTSMALWQTAFPNVVASRVYAGEGHTAQYRHWDQILVDMAGFGDYTVIGWHGRTMLVKADKADGYLAKGAVLGLAAWQQ